MSAEISSNNEQERHTDRAAAAELSQLISSLDLGSDTLTAVEFEQFTAEQEVQHSAVCAASVILCQLLYDLCIICELIRYVGAD